MKSALSGAIWLVGIGCVQISAQEPSPAESFATSKQSPGRLDLSSPAGNSEKNGSFEVPLPAHAARSKTGSTSPGFRVISARDPQSGPAERMEPPATYRLPDREEKPTITPEDSNLNLPSDLEITTTDTGEKILLPAGTYRQILQLPIDSPLLQITDQTRRDQSPPVQRKNKIPVTRNRSVNRFGSGTNRWRKSKLARPNDAEGSISPPTPPQGWGRGFGMRSRKRPTGPARHFISSLAVWGIPPPISWDGRPETPGRFPAISNTA